MRHFELELEQLKGKLLEMSALVEAAVQRSVAAVTQKDRSAAEQVLRDEARINELEMEIDEFAITLLATQQVVAADLRLVVAALKINTDLERMGDLSVHIAQRAVSLLSEPVIKPMVDICHMSSLVESMVRKSLDAFVQNDADMARSVLASDDAVDSLRTASYHELVSFMEKDPQNIPQALDLIGITKSLERIADHSTNIAEDVLFLVKGVDVRHHAEARQ
ncbi:MAG: phosphate signaling complex protein PhoU [Acidobacteriia bacterium]|nr:phosphate signaling complex protein PhoU [Terriglobia bacterium]